MLNTTLYAKVFGLYFVIMAVLMLAYPKRFEKHISGWNPNADYVFGLGALVMLIGLLVVNTHNIWVKDWRVFITLIGWLSLIKGVCLVACPGCIADNCKKFYKGNGYYITALVTLAIGGILCGAVFYDFKFCLSF